MFVSLRNTVILVEQELLLVGRNTYPIIGHRDEHRVFALLGTDCYFSITFGVFNGVVNQVTNGIAELSHRRWQFEYSP